MHLEHIYPAKGPAPGSHPYQMLINHGLSRSKAKETRSKSTKWRVMAAYQNNKKHEKFSKSRRKNPYLSICSITYANNFETCKTVHALWHLNIISLVQLLYRSFSLSNKFTATEVFASQYLNFRTFTNHFTMSDAILLFFLNLKCILIFYF